MKWIEKETAVSRRVLRLRGHLYLKIPWVETNDLVMSLLSGGEVCLVPSDKRWLTLCSCLNSEGQFKSEYKDEFEKKQALFNEWVSVSQNIGYYAEDLVRHAFIDEGYAVQKVTYQFADPLSGTGAVEIDADCVKTGFHLGVQVKNVVSEVFIDPDKIKVQTEIYKRLAREFEFCSKKGITPVLIAPFIDTSFYCFDDRHKGLHCQTLIQCLRPVDEDLCARIKEELKFGNLRAVNEVPQNVRDWIKRIPSMWNKRHGYIIDRPA
jgi:hypothetical protein